MFWDYWSQADRLHAPLAVELRAKIAIAAGIGKNKQQMLVAKNRYLNPAYRPLPTAGAASASTAAGSPTPGSPTGTGAVGALGAVGAVAGAGGYDVSGVPASSAAAAAAPSLSSESGAIGVGGEPQFLTEEQALHKAWEVFAHDSQFLLTWNWKRLSWAVRNVVRILLLANAILVRAVPYRVVHACVHVPSVHMRVVYARYARA